MALGLLLFEDQKTSVRSLYDDRLSLFPDELQLGDSLPLSLALVTRIGSLWSSRKFTPQALTSTTFRAALGLGFVPPVAGTLSFEYLSTPEDVSGELDYDFTAGDLEIALNLLDHIVLAGGLVVEQPDENERFFTITFNLVGARNAFVVAANNLVPLSSVEFARAITGDTTTREVVTLRILQTAGALTTISTAAASSGITLTQVTVGSGSANAQWRVTLTGEVYKGSWTLSKTTGTTGTSAAILFDDTEAQILAKLIATTGIGTGNASVSQEDEYQWLIEFVGTLALTAVTVTVNGGNLTAIPALTGNLDLGQPALQMLLGGKSERVVSLEIEKTVGAAAPVRVYSRDVLLTRPVIEVGMTDQAWARNQDGLTSIGSGVDLIAVVFPRVFGSAPTKVLVTVEKPSGGDNIFATVRRDTISTTGFTAELSGTTPDANHKLSWIAIP